MGEKKRGHAGKTKDKADRSDEEQRLAAELVDQSHGEESGAEVHRTYGHRLQIAGDLVESRRGKNVVEIIENRVDARELVEHADCDGKKYGDEVFAGEKWFGTLRLLKMYRVHNFSEFSLVIGRAQRLQDASRFLNALLSGQPAGTPRNSEQHDQKQKSRRRADAQLPPPFEIAQTKFRHAVIVKVRKQDTDHDINLQHSHKTPAQIRGSQLCNVDRRQDGRAAEAQSADETEDYQRGPTPGKGAAAGRDHA